jgi:hypothetical protein
MNFSLLAIFAKITALFFSDRANSLPRDNSLGVEPDGSKGKNILFEA